MNKIKYYFYEKKWRHLEGSAGGHSILHIWEFSFTCHKTKQGANWIGASSRLCASFSCCPPEDPEDLDLEDYTPKRFFSLKTTQGGLEFVSWSTGSIPEYKDCLVFFLKKRKKTLWAVVSCTVTSAEPQDWIIALHSIKNHVLFSVLSITASPLLRRQSDSNTHNGQAPEVL